MAETKYGQYIKRLSFKDYGPGSYRQATRLSSDDLGIDAQIEFGTYWAAGRIGGDAHTHNFDQMMFWFGADTSDMGELGAEIELYLGAEKEMYMITTSTAVFAPKGFPHFPANIVRMNKRFIFMTVSCSSEYKEIPVPSDGKPLPNKPVWGFFAKYRERVVQPPFLRKGAWSYGPENPDDSGGHLASIRGKDLETMILCESLKKAPYRFGPEPKKPHAHNKPEILIFMGADTKDISVLGGEIEFALGREQEIHTITSPTAVVVPGGLLHCPLTVTKVDRPFILTDVRPFGVDAPGTRQP